ncbi:23S rRNA (pseudouridine(1915)-N(3))-methyltransferase RlmH [Candidatus Woesearchaeota archaeon]|nr:23S rRNA (pseudouridine(1915)-N(3))-methyltransferase RlmH [Candidatus Woesearchaeota archaeon]
MIEIVAFGKIKNQNLRILYQDYLKRISRFSKVSSIELKEAKDKNPMKIQASEAESASRYIEKTSNYVVCMDPKGKELTSDQLADLLKTHPDSSFLIGGPYGWDTKVRELSHFAFSLSKLTFSHDLSRLILAEQLYRALTIINNHPYHK